MTTFTNPFRQAYVYFVVDRDPEKGLTTCAAELIDAANDVEAIEIAMTVFALVDDVFHSFGLLHGHRIVACGPHAPGQSPTLRVTKVNGRSDGKVRDLVESLTESFPTLLRSTKLQARLTEFQSTISGG
jgi:hypothetical protein